MGMVRGKGLLTGVSYKKLHQTKIFIFAINIMVNLVIDGNGDKGGGSADTAHRLSSAAD